MSVKNNGIDQNCIILLISAGYGTFLHTQLDSLGRFSVYALEGRGGEVRWHFTPGDTDFVPAFSPVRYHGDQVL